MVDSCRSVAMGPGPCSAAPPRPWSRGRGPHAEAAHFQMHAALGSRCSIGPFLIAHQQREALLAGRDREEGQEGPGLARRRAPAPGLPEGHGPGRRGGVRPPGGRGDIFAQRGVTFSRNDDTEYVPGGYEGLLDDRAAGEQPVHRRPVSAPILWAHD